MYSFFKKDLSNLVWIGLVLKMDPKSPGMMPKYGSWPEIYYSGWIQNMVLAKLRQPRFVETKDTLVVPLQKEIKHQYGYASYCTK